MTDLAAELQAASDERIAGWREERERESEPKEVSDVAVDRDRFRALLDGGGRVEATLRSRKTGEHVRVLLVAKKKNANGRGFVSRASRAGRVGLGEADVVFAEDPLAEFPDNRVGMLWLDTGRWVPAPGADRLRAWTASHLLDWARAASTFDLEAAAEVFVATRCSYCGHKLEDPVSIERGVGPECFGKATGSKSAKRHALLPEEVPE